MYVRSIYVIMILHLCVLCVSAIELFTHTTMRTIEIFFFSYTKVSHTSQQALVGSWWKIGVYRELSLTQSLVSELINTSV